MSSESSAPENRNETHLGDESAKELSTDEVALIFGFFTPKDIMRLRRVRTTWRDAAKETIVPLSEPEFVVDSVRKYNAMRVMSTALPNLQRLSICNLGDGDKYSDGEDPNEEEAAETANLPSHDIDIISNFSKLRILEIYMAPLNGRYPVLFNFPLLQKLTIKYCDDLKWDLDMLEGLPSLKELHCFDNPHLTGNLSSLRVLKGTLEIVKIDCRLVEGNFMDLADFQHLKKLNLVDTNVRGDIRDIGEDDFSALERLFLPVSVIGGIGYKFQNVSDVPSFMQAIHQILQRTPSLFEGHGLLSKAFNWWVSRHSPDRYDWFDERERRCPLPPFYLQFIQAGSRLGWSWCTCSGLYSCEINWLDPEPSSDSSDYETYVQELQRLERRIDFYRGYHQPPTEQEYRRLCESF